MPEQAKPEEIVHDLNIQPGPWGIERKNGGYQVNFYWKNLIRFWHYPISDVVVFSNKERWTLPRNIKVEIVRGSVI